MKTFKYLTVLDFEQGEVCQYPLANGSINHTDLTMKFVENLELRITELGHNLTNCEWMVHKNKPIIH